MIRIYDSDVDFDNQIINNEHIEDEKDFRSRVNRLHNLRINKIDKFQGYNGWKTK